MSIIVFKTLYNIGLGNNTGIKTKLKPESWDASFGADGVAHGRTRTDMLFEHNA